MPGEIAYCPRCRNVFHASSKRPRCPQCKAIAGVRVLTLDDLRIIIEAARRRPRVLELFESPPISENGAGSVPSDSSAPREERVGDTTPKSPPVAERSPPPTFFDPRVNLDSVERMFWNARVDKYDLAGQRDWIREHSPARISRATNADLDAIREKFLERGPPAGVLRP